MLRHGTLERTTVGWDARSKLPPIAAECPPFPVEHARTSRVCTWPIDGILSAPGIRRAAKLRARPHRHAPQHALVFRDYRGGTCSLIRGRTAQGVNGRKKVAGARHKTE